MTDWNTYKEANWITAPTQRRGRTIKARVGTRASSGCRSVSWLLLWLTLSAIALAQSPERHAYYLGHIGEEPIQLELELLQDGDGSSIVGWYYHQQVGEPISLEGFLGQAGDLVLHEPTGAGESAGRFTAKVPWSANEYLTRIEGVFREGRVELPFTLSGAAEYATFDLSQGNIRVRSTFPVFMQPQTRIFNATVTRAATSNLFESFEEAQAFAFDDEIYHAWTFDYDLSISYLSDDLLSLNSTLWHYTGGAHGNTNHSAINLVVRGNGVLPLELAELFLPDADFLSDLASYVLEELKKQEASWVMTGEVSELQEGDLAAFSLLPKGLRFAFSPYQVGPYVQGPFFVMVPYKVLAAHIDPEGPLARFLE